MSVKSLPARKLSLAKRISRSTFPFVNGWRGLRRRVRTHRRERVDHADEEVLLPGVGEELDVEEAAVVADHREARDLALRPVEAQDRDEPPVHLVGLPRPRLEAPPAVPLRRRLPPLWRDEVPVPGDVGLHGREPALVALGAQPVEYHLRVRDALAELVVDEARVPGQDGCRGLLACVSVRKRLEAVALDRSCLRPGEAGPAAELRQVAPLGVEPVARLGGHVLERPVYNLLQVIVSLAHFNSPPNAGALATPA